MDGSTTLAKPTRTVSPGATTTGRTARLATLGNGVPSAWSAFAEMTAKSDSAIRAANASSLTSNSWLPSAAASSPSAFRTATICLPASRSPSTRAVPSADGLR